MSATKPNNRNELINWCLRDLGEPVIRINVAREQIEDKVDEALEYFHRNHYDGSMTVYLPIQVTQEVKDQGYFKIDDSILGIARVLPATGQGYSGPDAMLTAEWQIMASYARQMAGGIGVNVNGQAGAEYAMYQMSRGMMQYLMGNNHTIMQWSRHTDRLFLTGVDSKLTVGSFIVVEAMRILVPDEFPQVWNDPFLKKYCTALIKKQWGNNLRKMRNIPLAGGITLQGEEILQEANDEIAGLQETMQSEWQEPPMPRLG